MSAMEVDQGASGAAIVTPVPFPPPKLEPIPTAAATTTGGDGAVAAASATAATAAAAASGEWQQQSGTQSVQLPLEDGSNTNTSNSAAMNDPESQAAGSVVSHAVDVPTSFAVQNADAVSLDDVRRIASSLAYPYANPFLTSLDLRDCRIGRLGAQALCTALSAPPPPQPAAAGVKSDPDSKAGSAAATATAAAAAATGAGRTNGPNGTPPLSPSAAPAAAPQAAMTLHTLRLANCCLGVSGTRALSGALRVPHCTIITLDLSGNGVGAAGATALASAMYQNKSLSSLSLTNNVLLDDGAIALAGALRVHPLVELFVAHNFIGSSGCKSLCDMLVFNRTLRTLDLCFNNIVAEGAKHLGDALRANRTLNVLHLAVNFIGTEGEAHIERALWENVALMECDIADYRILKLLHKNKILHARVIWNWMRISPVIAFVRAALRDPNYSRAFNRPIPALLPRRAAPYSPIPVPDDVINEYTASAAREGITAWEAAQRPVIAEAATADNVYAAVHRGTRWLTEAAANGGAESPDSDPARAAILAPYAPLSADEQRLRALLPETETRTGWSLPEFIIPMIETIGNFVEREDGPWKEHAIALTPFVYTEYFRNVTCATPAAIAEQAAAEAASIAAAAAAAAASASTSSTTASGLPASSPTSSTGSVAQELSDIKHSAGALASPLSAGGDDANTIYLELAAHPWDRRHHNITLPPLPPLPPPAAAAAAAATATGAAAAPNGAAMEDGATAAAAAASSVPATAAGATAAAIPSATSAAAMAQRTASERRAAMSWLGRHLTRLQSKVTRALPERVASQPSLYVDETQFGRSPTHDAERKISDEILRRRTIVTRAAAELDALLAEYKHATAAGSVDDSSHVASLHQFLNRMHALTTDADAVLAQPPVTATAPPVSDAAQTAIIERARQFVIDERRRLPPAPPAADAVPEASPPSASPPAPSPDAESESATPAGGDSKSDATTAAAAPPTNSDANGAASTAAAATDSPAATVKAEPAAAAPAPAPAPRRKRKH